MGDKQMTKIYFVFIMICDLNNTKILYIENKFTYEISPMVWLGPNKMH